MLIFQGGQLEGLSPEAMEAQMGKWMAWVERLNKEGRYVSGEPLLPGGKLVTGSKKNGDGWTIHGRERSGRRLLRGECRQHAGSRRDCKRLPRLRIRRQRSGAAGDETGYVGYLQEP